MYNLYIINGDQIASLPTLPNRTLSCLDVSHLPHQCWRAHTYICAPPQSDTCVYVPAYVYTQSPGVLWAQRNRVVVGRASSSAPAAARARSSLIRGVNQGYRESRTLYSRALCALPLARARACAHDGAQCWCWWCDGGCCSACMRACVCACACAMRMRGAHGFLCVLDC